MHEDSIRFCLWFLNANGILCCLCLSFPLHIYCRRLHTDGNTFSGIVSNANIQSFVRKERYLKQFWITSLCVFIRILVLPHCPVCARWAPRWKEVHYDVCRCYPERLRWNRIRQLFGFSAFDFRVVNFSAFGPCPQARMQLRSSTCSMTARSSRSMALMRAPWCSRAPSASECGGCGLQWLPRLQWGPMVIFALLATGRPVRSLLEEAADWVRCSWWPEKRFGRHAKCHSALALLHSIAGYSRLFTSASDSQSWQSDVANGIRPHNYFCVLRAFNGT